MKGIINKLRKNKNSNETIPSSNEQIKTIKHLSPNEMAHLYPLNRLPFRVVKYLTSDGIREVYKPGEQLFSKGERIDDALYLLDGSIRFLDNEGRSHCIDGQSDRKCPPFIFDKIADKDAFASDRIEIIRIPGALIKDVLHSVEIVGEGKSAGDEQLVDDDETAKIIIAIRDSILNDLELDNIKLPAMPDLAVRISNAVEDPVHDSIALARIIQTDPALTARVIQISNNVAFKGESRIDDCTVAVTRLGRTTLKNIVVSFMLKGLFKSDSKFFTQLMNDLWKTSARVGAICYVLASITTGLSPSRAMLAGLTHRIGAIPVIDYAKNYPSLTNNGEVVGKVIDKCAQIIGEKLLLKWQFGDDLVDVVVNASNWMRDESEAIDYVDLVILSKLHHIIGTTQSTAVPRLDLIPSFHKLSGNGIELSPSLSINVLDEAENEIRSVEQLLMG